MLDVLPANFRNSQLILLYIANVKISEIGLEGLLKGLYESPYRLIVPCGNHSGIPEIQNILNCFKPHADCCFVNVADDLLWQIADMCKAVCVMGCSTFTLECLWRGLPVAEIFSPGQPLRFASDEIGVCFEATPCTIAEWAERTQELFATDAHVAKVKAYVDHEIATPDAAQEIADAILAD